MGLAKRSKCLPQNSYGELGAQSRYKRLTQNTTIMEIKSTKAGTRIMADLPKPRALWI